MRRNPGIAVTAAGKAVVASMKRTTFSVAFSLKRESAYAASGFTVSDASIESTTRSSVFAKARPRTKRYSPTSL